MLCAGLERQVEVSGELGALMSLSGSAPTSPSPNLGKYRRLHAAAGPQ